MLPLYFCNFRIELLYIIYNIMIVHACRCVIAWHGRM